MADPRIDTVTAVLRENGHNATGTGASTDELATQIVAALDREYAGQADEEETDENADDDAAADLGPPANPETPGGTGTEGGAGNPAS